MVKILAKCLILISIFQFLGCSNQTNYETTEEIPNVPWQNYSPDVKNRIDSLIQSNNCNELQNEFNIAEENSQNQRNRTGTGNHELMGYIDYYLKQIKCY